MQPLSRGENPRRATPAVQLLDGVLEVMGGDDAIAELRDELMETTLSDDGDGAAVEGSKAARVGGWANPWANPPTWLVKAVLEQLPLDYGDEMLDEYLASQNPCHKPPPPSGWSRVHGYRDCGFCRIPASPSKDVRLVCSGWLAAHDALVTRLTVHPCISDNAVRQLVQRFPALVNVEMKERPGPFARWFLSNEKLLALSSLTGLTSLELNGTNLTDELVQTMVSLDGLQGLTSLNLTHSYYIKAEQLRAVSTLPELTTLNLSWIRHWLKDGVIQPLAAFTRLTSLDISECSSVTKQGLQAVSGLTGLKSLNLEQTVADGLRTVSCLTGLTFLNLSQSKESSEALRGVGGLTRLNTLYLVNSQGVDDEVLRAATNATGLTSLDLKHCSNITGQGLRALSCLTGLADLDIRDTRQAWQGMEALRRETASSNLRIHQYF